jgi:Tfp pilus assembly protein PilV
MKRQGLTILEVLVAVAIFFLSVGVIGQLLLMAGERAMEVRFQSEGAQLCQAKLAEIAAGAIPFESMGDTPLEEDDSWQWSMEAEQGAVAGLWQVKVSMSRIKSDGTRAEYCSVSQMILDPAARGSTMDTVAISGTEATGGGSSSSGSGSSSPSSGSSGTGGTSGSSSGSSGGTAGSSGWSTQNSNNGRN